MLVTDPRAAARPAPSARAPLRTRAAAARARLLRRVPPWALGGALLVALSSFDSTPALRDALTQEAVTDARLVRGGAYALLAPICGLYDAMTLLAASQHVGLLVSLVALYALWRALRPRRAAPLHRRALREGALAVGALLLLVAFYAVGALAPRPMARLVVDDEDSLVVDFHAHTDASWDSRRPFTLATRLGWHGAAGYDAVFVSDHATFAGWTGGAAGGGARPGGAIALPAAEVRHHHQHLVLLGDPALHAGLIVDGHLDSAAVERLRAAGLPEPVALLTLPARLAQLPDGAAGTLPIGGVEISDASPKGLEFAHRHRAALLALADSLDVPLVAGTNHHGWGRTTAAWNVVRIPGWRDLPPAVLAERIAQRIRDEGHAAVRVIERNPPRPATRGEVAVTMPTAAWRLFATLSPAERLGWLGWIGALVVAGRCAGRRMRAA